MNPLPWLDPLEQAGLTAGLCRAPERQAALARARALEPLSDSEIVGFLRATEEDDLFETASEVRRIVFGRRVRMFAPLYYSNVCANDCLYCGFRRSLGSTRRRILTPAEVEEEAAALLDHGHRRILLIASEDPGPRGLEMALAAVEAIRIAGVSRAEPAEPRIAVEIAPRPAAEFARLAGAGVSGYILFQETYDRALYPQVHPAGPKADFENRVSGPARAAEGGIRELGLGVLYGLGDPILDTRALIAHARHLHHITGTPVASVSVPRLEPAEGVPFTTAPPHPVDNALWLRILAVLRLALPWTDLIVSTREEIPMRRRSLAAGVTVFSAGSRTDPGGYRLAGASREQFRVGDHRSLPEVAEDLRALGYEPTVT